MKPDWDTLSSEYQSSSSVVIADVDCTVEQDLCKRFDVKGYPTIKYFNEKTPATGTVYEGGRDLVALKEFAVATLGPVCGPANRDLCSEQQLAVMDEASALPEGALDAAIEEMEKAVADLEQTLVDKTTELETEMKAKEFKLINRRGLYHQTKGELYKHKVFRYIWVNLVEITIGVFLVVGGLYAFFGPKKKKGKKKRR